MEEEKVNKVIDEQQSDAIFKELCLVKEEMTILGYWMCGNRYKKYFSKYTIFSYYTVRSLWKKLVESKFECSEEELKSSYPYDEKTDFKSFIEICKDLGKDVPEKDFEIIMNKVEKFYYIRELCENIYLNMEDEKERQQLKDKVSVLAQGKRIKTLSLEQIKNFLTSYNVNKYNDVIENSSRISKGLTKFLEHKKTEQDKGIELPFSLLNKAINGLRKGQLLATGMMSNDGKTRLMIRLVSNLALIQNKKVLIISNEMTKDEIKYCFITSIINNEEFRELFKNINIIKTEREIRNGIYNNDVESENVKKVTSYIEEKFVNNITIIHTTNYSANDLKDIILTHYAKNDIDYFFYDTLKADIESMSNWDGLKVIATVLSELAKEYNISIWTNIQLVNRPQPLSADVDNIANSKQLYHVLDTLLLFTPIPKDEYTRYVYWNSSNNPNKDIVQILDKNKKYYVCRISKNRIGAKPNLLFEVDLDRNIWKEIGQVAYYNNIKGFLNG